MFLDEQELISQIEVSEEFPGYFLAKVAIEIELNNGSTQEIIGCGADQNKNKAKIKSISELYERLIFSLGNIYYNNFEFDALILGQEKSRKYSTNQLYKPLIKYEKSNKPVLYSSTGISCHENIEEAYKHCVMEIIERDQISLFWRLKDWPVKIYDETMLDNKILSFLKNIGYKIKILNCSIFSDVKVFIVCLISSNNEITMGSAAGYSNSTIMKALMEAYILQQSLAILKNRENKKAIGSERRILDGSYRSNEILKYIANKPDVNSKVYCTNYKDFFGDFWFVDLDPNCKIIPDTLKAVRVFPEYSFNTCDQIDEFKRKLNNLSKFRHQIVPISKHINLEDMPFG